MRITTLQWNIGGAHIRTADADPTRMESYCHDNVAYIASIIEKYNPDIITCQETHATDEWSQMKELGAMLGYASVVNHPYDQSHIDPAYTLGQGMLARFPILTHDFSLYHNPLFEMDRPHGEHWVTHEKGMSRFLMQLPEGRELTVLTTHSVPFRKFGKALDDPDVLKVLEDMNAKATVTGPLLLQGDFNYDQPSVSALYPDLFNAGAQEVLQQDPTTPKGRRYDHVIYRGISVEHSEVIESVLTDHFPIYSIFQV